MNKKISLLVVLFFSLLGSKALFHPGLFTAHDIWHQVARFYYYQAAILDSQIPPYWISNMANEYGYPLFFFSYHLPWIIGSILLLLGFNLSLALKLLFFIAYFASGVFMQIFASKLFKNQLAGTLSAILYLWVPYHFLEIFVGASMGIMFVFAFLPLLFLGLNLIYEKNKNGVILVAISFAGIILSHLMHVLFTLPLIFLFIIWKLFEGKNNRKSLVINLTLGFLGGVLISAFYLLPAKYYSQFTQVNNVGGLNQLYERNFINFFQLIYSKWGFGPIVENAKEGSISFQLGIAQWLSIIIMIFLLIAKKIKSYRNWAIFILTGIIINVFFMLDFSTPLWNIVEKFVVLDYPFRFLIVLTFLASLAGGLVIAELRKKFQLFVFVILVSVALYTNRNHIKVNLYTHIPISDYIASEKTTNTYNEYLPLKADPKLLDQESNIIEPNTLKVSNFSQDTKQLSFTLNSTKSEKVRVRQFYFPGQTAYVDQQKINITADEKGRISFNINQGIHNILIRFEETPIMKVGKLISLIAILSILGYILKKLSFNKT